MAACSAPGCYKKQALPYAMYNCGCVRGDVVNLQGLDAHLQYVMYVFVDIWNGHVNYDSGH